MREWVASLLLVAGMMAGAALDVPPPGPATAGELLGAVHRAGPESTQDQEAGAPARGAPASTDGPFYLRPVATAAAGAPTAIAVPERLPNTSSSLPSQGQAPDLLEARPPLPPTERSGRRRLPVWLTFYVDRGPMAMGPWVFPGAAAVDPGCIGHGTVFRVAGDPVLRVALDTGGLVRGCQVDLWMESEAAGWAYLSRYGDRAEIEILQEALDAE